MPLALPKPFLDPLVRERGHRETGVGDAEAAFFVAHHRRRGVDGQTLGFGGGQGPGVVQSVS